MVFNGIQNIVNKNKKSIWRGERENVGRRETPYTCSTDIRVKEKEEARISQEESVEINEQTSINNDTIIDKLYIKVKQIISKYIKKGPRKIPYYAFCFSLLQPQPPMKAVILLY